MSPSTVLGYAAPAPGQPLEPFTYEAPDLEDQEIRVSVTHCGVCFTDIHAIDDHFGVFSFPLLPGHEIVGRVTETGKAASGHEVGDLVGIGWQGRCCGGCEWCEAEQEHLCQEIPSCGTWTPYGGFASEVVVDGRFAYPLPAGMAAETAAVLMCAGIAVYPPLRLFATGPSCRVGIVGIGGLGHLAIQFAHALGADVTALSSSPGKEVEARRFGADHFVVSTDREAMAGIEYGFDLLICTAHGGIDWGTLLMSLRRTGRLVLVAFSPVHLEAAGGDGGAGPLVDLIAHELSITGSFLGSRADMREMLGFAQEHGITPQVESMPMSRVNDAIRLVRENRARYRVVLVNE
ncbi:MAG: NAD(P)-dependent alcohol dehydrogenase [Actinobacteria bacterium]|nr:NAD(P)-dependent alcohol dehydrogenase [Actinomycetota bacterium]